MSLKRVGIDLNECANKNACCGEDNICVNTEGSYKCFCDKGYYYDGNYCRGWYDIYVSRI